MHEQNKINKLTHTVSRHAHILYEYKQWGKKKVHIKTSEEEMNQNHQEINLHYVTILSSSSSSSSEYCDNPYSPGKNPQWVVRKIP